MFGGYISRRWELAFMLFTGLVVLYTLRVNMSVAAQQMRLDLNWSEDQKGLVLSSFYWGYTVGQMPASLIAQNYGAKWLFGLSVAIPAFLTLLVPAASHHSFTAALLIRVVIGFFESASFPALYHFFPIWVPTVEKTFMIPFIVSGIYVGEIIGFSFSGILVESSVQIRGVSCGGWPSVFYVFGLMGLLWFPLWVCFAYESPIVHPYISAEELDFMDEAANSATSHDMESKHSASVSRFGAATSASSSSSSAASEYELVDITGDSIHDREAVAAALAIMKIDVDIDTAEDSMEIESMHQLSRERRDGRINNEEALSPLHAARNRNELMTHLDQDDNNISNQDLNSTSHNNGNNDSIDATNALSSTKDTISKGQSVVVVVPPTSSFVTPVTGRNRLEEEVEMIELRAEIAAQTPWRQFFIHPVAWCLYASNFQYGWMNFTLMSEMPSFFTDVLGFDIRSAGILCIFPYLALFVSALCFGKGFDWLQHYHGWTTTSIRHAAQISAYFCSGVGLILCSYSTQSAYGAYTWMIVTLVFFGSNQSGLGCIWTDIAPRYSTSLNSIGNTVGAMAGILGPIIVAACTDEWSGVYGWRVAFYITFALNCITLLAWLLMIRAEIIPSLNY